MSAISATALSVSWTAPASELPITGYTLRHRENGETDWNSIRLSASTTSRNFTGLDPGSTHQFEVRAHSDDGDSAWSPTGTGTTANMTANIEAVSTSVTEGQDAQFRITLTSAASLTVNVSLSWTGGYGSSTGATVTFNNARTATLNVGTSEVSNPSDGSVTATITSGTGYNVGTNSSATVTITRKASPPESPSAPNITGLTTTNVRVQWTAPSSETNIVAYRLRLREKGATEWSESARSGTTALITGLRVDTTYEAQVQARNADGSSEWSATGEGATLDLLVSISADQTKITEGEHGRVHTVPLPHSIRRRWTSSSRGPATSAPPRRTPSRS